MYFTTKIKHLILLLISIFCINNIFASDTIQKNISYKNNTERINILINNAQKEIKSNPKNAVLKLLDAYSNARKINNLELQIKSIKLLGKAHTNLLQYKQALKYFFIASDLSKRLNNNSEKVYAYSNIGYTYYLLQDSANAKKYLNRALELKKYFISDSIFSGTYTSLAMFYAYFGNLKESVNNYNKAYEIDKKYNIKTNLANDLINLGVLYYNLNKIDLALKYLYNGIDSSLVINNNENVIFCKINILDIKIKEQNNLSPQILDDLLKLKKEIFENKISGLYFPIYELIIYYYKQTKDYKSALTLTDEYNVYKDSIINADNIKEANNLKIQFENQNKETENKLLKQNLEIQEIKYNKERFVKISLIILISLIIILSIFIYSKIKTKIKATKEIEIKNKEISKINEAYVTLNNSLEEKIEERNKELKKQLEKLKKTEGELLILLSKYKNADTIKENFLNNVSNEIRTPLNSINGLTEMINKKIPEGDCEKISTFSNGIKQSVAQLLYIFNNFIDHAKTDYDTLTISKVNCSFIGVIQKTIDIYQFRINEKNLKININVNTNDKIIVDKTLFTKIFTDILNNAIKYTKDGEINISAEQVNNEKEILIKVSDTGIGIPSNILPHIFDNFEIDVNNVKKYDGAGLGLKVVKKYVDLMNGRIEVSSKQGKGTTVKLYFKSANKYGKNLTTSINKKTLVSNKELKKQDFQILIVEDDKFNQLFLSSLIEEIATPEIVADAEETLKLLENKSKEDLGFDLIFMDINLPGQWDGISLMNEIKRRWPEYKKVIFIAQTAYTEEFDRNRIKEAGFDDYISKPIDTKELINKIKIHLLS